MDIAGKQAVGQAVKRAVLTQLGWTLLYLATLGVALAVALGMPGLGAWRVPIILAPLLPALGILSFVLRQFRGADEMQRRNQLIAVAAAFGITLFLMVAYSLLEAIGWPRLPMWANLIALHVIWTSCIWTQVLRYR